MQLMFQCSNVQMFKCSNVQMFKCSNVQMFKCSNVKCQMSNIKCQILFRLNFCWNVTPHFFLLEPCVGLNHLSVPLSPSPCSAGLSVKRESSVGCKCHFTVRKGGGGVPSMSVTPVLPNILSLRGGRGGTPITDKIRKVVFDVAPQVVFKVKGGRPLPNWMFFYTSCKGGGESNPC